MTVLVAGIALGASNAWSQELPFVEYRVDSEINPLPSASISDVFRDRHGYLWLVVYSSGLVRYDGHDMVQYDTSDGLPSNLVVEAVEDGKGHLWVSTRKGIAVSEKALGDYPAGKRIEFTTSFGGTKLASTDLKAESLAVDGGGRLWIGLSGAVLRYSHGPKGLETKRVVLEPDSKSSPLDTMALGTQRGGPIWVGLSDGRLLTVDPESGTVSQPAGWDPTKCPRLTKVFGERGGGLVGGCYDGAVWQIDSGDRELESLRWRVKPNGNKVAGISQDNAGYIWVSARGGGFRRLGQNPGEPDLPYKRIHGLISDGAEGVFEDPEGNLWFAQTGGVSKLRFNSRAFRNYRATSRGGEEPALPSPGVRAVRTQKRGEKERLWIATGKGAVVKEGDLRSDIIGVDEGLKTQNIWLFCGDSAGRQWINDSAGINAVAFEKSSIPKGFEDTTRTRVLGEDAWVSRRDWTRSRSCLTVPLDPGGQAALLDDAVCFAGQGEITCWADGGWIKVDASQGLPETEVQSLAVDHEGRLWVGTRDRGIYRTKVTFGDWLRRQSLRVRNKAGVSKSKLFELAFDESKGLPTNVIQAMTSIGRDMWVGTDRALVRIDTGPMSIVSMFGIDEGMPHESAFSTDYSAASKTLWVGTNGGLAEVDPRRGKVLRSITRQHGLLDNEVWWHQSLHVSADGTIHYGTSKGLAKFRPMDNRKNSVEPMPTFRSVEFSQDDYGTNTFKASFAALSFADERSLLYKTRVVGYQDEWGEPTNANELSLMNLPAVLVSKTYTVEVMAANNDGVWSKEPIRTSFEVEPAWWLRGEFLTGFTILFLGAFITFYRLRVRTIEERARALKKLSDNLQMEVSIRTQAQKELEQALNVAREASQLKSEFLANISHELRTPLNAIVNVPGPLLKDYVDVRVWNCEKCGAAFQDDEDPRDGAPLEIPDCPECGAPKLSYDDQMLCVGDLKEHCHFLRRIETSGRHLLRVVNDLLNFSKLEAGKMNLAPSALDLTALMEEVVATVEGLASEKSIKLETPNREVMPSLIGDHLKLAQVFLNLVGNAIKFTPEGGRIIISMDSEEREGKDVLLFGVHDTGIGIPESSLEKVFESFRQVDGSHTRSHQGTGLGLAITRQLIELHGGRIWVESELGQGSHFLFYVPCKGPDIASA